MEWSFGQKKNQLMGKIVVIQLVNVSQMNGPEIFSSSLNSI